ncbi:hypothetical protein [Cellulomonas massiliensis]|uniref:hypothetical protein n=1 Tax=Cellulomonas massiliensis TaxID=1465811 RepID=UPI0002DF4082|nr:hypothetical protein [Cellulomonas massiliensis]
MSSSRPRPRRLALAAAGLAVAGLAVAACSPILTQRSYNASDGASVSVGKVAGINLLVVSEAEGEPGALRGGITNRGDEDRTVTLTFEGAPEITVPVAAHQTVLFQGVDLTQDDGVEQKDVVIPAVSAAPGGSVTTTFATEDGSASLPVPVLDATLPEYATAVPTRMATPMPTPSATS